MYSNPSTVKEIVYLYNTDSIPDIAFLGMINRAESVINSELRQKYIVPIEKLQNLTGVISTTADDNQVVGVGTLFTTELKPYDYIRLNSNGECLRVLSIEDDLTFTASSNAIYTASNSSFIDIPASFSLMSEYLSSHLIMMTYFSEKAYNQETGRYNLQFWNIYKKTLDELKDGKGYLSELKPQIAEKTTARMIEVMQTDTLTLNQDFVNEILTVFDETSTDFDNV